MKAKINVLIRRIRRSIRRDREKWIKGGILAAVLLVIIIFAGSCACSRGKTKEEPDAASQGVLKISPIPSPTPTVAAATREVSKDAVATSGNVTMVNEYLVQKEAEASSSGSSAAGQQSGENSTGDGNNEGEASGDGTDNGDTSGDGTDAGETEDGGN